MSWLLSFHRVITHQNLSFVILNTFLNPNTQSVNNACNVVSYGATTNNVYFDNFGFFHNTISVAALLANYGSVANLAWCIDSGAIYHVTRDAGILS